MQSFNGSVTDYEKLLGEIHTAGVVELRNDNFDTGTVTNPGDYPLADSTYADLLDRQAKDHFSATTPALRDTLLTFYADPNAPIATKKKPKQWAKVRTQVDELKAYKPAASITPSGAN